MKKLLYTFILLVGASFGFGILAQAQSPLDKAMRFLEQNAEKSGLVESDYAGTMVGDMYTDRNSGITYIYLNQAINNIPVQNAMMVVAVSPQGKIVSSSNKYIQNISKKVTSTTTNIQPVAAIQSAVNHLGLKSSGMPSVLRSDSEKGEYQFGEADFADNKLVVKKVYIQDGEKVKLAWKLAIDEKQDEDYYNTFVDASSGKVIKKFNFTVKCTFHKDQYAHHRCNHDVKEKSVTTFEEASEEVGALGTYNVFAFPAESPIHGVRQNLTDPHFLDASPYGWHDTDGVEGAEYTITRGNNVHAYLDKENSGFSLDDEPDGGAGLVFDFPYDVMNSAVANEQAATTNLFYTVNMIHDITSRLGFNEEAGNFQARNYNPQGFSGDYVLAQSSDGINLATPTLNNANFATPEDGSSGQMQMYLWENPSGILSIDAPAELAGFVNPVGTSENATIPFGGFIPQESEDPITGKIAIAHDGSPVNATTCCNPIANPDDIVGNIALIDRGLCDFSLKAYHAEQAGATSVLICNVVGAGGDGEEVIGMNGGDEAENVTIVPLFLRKSDCDRIRASITAGIDVTVSIQNRPPMGPTYLDGSVDNGIIAHEFGHGISNRLIGGPTNTSCLTSDEQMGEGISDYFSLVFTVEEGDKGSDARGIGNYADGQPANGRGIRTYPYSTDFDINDLTYDDIKGTTSIYTLGEVWTMIAWEVYWGLVDAQGLDITWEDETAGNYIAVRLAIEGMKLAGCNPSFIDMRDGMLNAEDMIYGGAYNEILWTAFAKRGLGYLATDGGSSADRNDGSESFDPPPLSVKKLKVQKSVTTVVKAKDEVTITLTAQNHIPEQRTGVMIIDNIPDGMTYVDGSASMPATYDAGVLTIDVGTMEYEDEIEVTYTVLVSEGAESARLFYDDVDNADFGQYGFDATEGFNIWQPNTDIANSGIVSWWASQPDTEIETDFYMDIPELTIVGDRPVLRFMHRYDAESGIDGGFLQVSRNGGVIFEDVKDKWIRNGYPISINYSTFAIPSLEGFSGSSNGEFVDSYLDLSEYKGNDVRVRFRFGTNATGGTMADIPGWFVDDLELIDLNTFESFACIISDSDDDECSAPVSVIVDSGTTIGTKDDELQGFEIGISPNPASEYISVSIKSEINTAAQLNLTAIDGRIISSKSLLVTNNESVRSFDVSALASGMYLLQVKTESGLSTRKIVIQ